MKSEWHRYNLKRRVAQLPAIDEATFNSKIAVHSSKEEPSSEKTSKKQLTKKDLRRQQKEALQKQREELLAVRRAIQSKLTLEQNETNEGSIEADVRDNTGVTNDSENLASSNNEEVTEEQLLAEKLANRVEILPTTCLFCPEKLNASFETIEENIAHMFKSHGLYVPETKFLVDKEGLLKYLGEKIGLGNVCLVCSYQGKNLEAVREHMKTKRHMKIPYENENEKLEISDFYDFTSTYDNVPFAKNVDVSEEDWEDVSDSEDINEEDQEDEELLVNEDPIINTGVELVLPSGAVVGHRSMARYYRQNLPPERVLSEGHGTVIAAGSRHFITGKDKRELAIQKRTWGREKKREDINDRRAAKFINNQPHFRDPLLQ